MEALSREMEFLGLNAARPLFMILCPLAPTTTNDNNNIKNNKCVGTMTDNIGATNNPASEISGNHNVTKAVSALNVYKKVAIIRGSDDVLTYEDPDGNIKTVTDLHLAAVESVRAV
jgi:hypothetical protein